MLVSFSVENFRSINSLQTLTFKAKKAQKGFDDHCVSIPSLTGKILRIAAIFGPNSAGKSNLIKAIEFAKNLVVHGSPLPKTIPVGQFRFNQQKEKESKFEFEFVNGDRLFCYSFAIMNGQIVKESLFASNSRNRMSNIFSREGSAIDFSGLEAESSLQSSLLDILNALRTLGVRPNQLLLNRIVDLDAEKRDGILNDVVSWFSDSLTIIQPNESFASIIDFISDLEEFKNFASDFLNDIGTGVLDLEVKKTSIDSEQLSERFVKHLQESDNVRISSSSGMSLSIDPTDPSKVIRRNLFSKREIEGIEYSLPFDQESDGTQRFLHLLPALFLLRETSRVFVIDEVDRSLHPLLVRKMIDFFVECCSERSQMIVTSHLIETMDYLRRDEIWFADKGKGQETNFFSLSNFGIRRDLKISKKYMEGGFGAIPLLRKNQNPYSD